MLTATQEKMMRHALGYDHPKMAPGWRNRYVVSPKTPAGLLWGDLVRRGLAADDGELSDGRGAHFYSVTDAGKAALAGKPE